MITCSPVSILLRLYGEGRTFYQIKVILAVWDSGRCKMLKSPDSGKCHQVFLFDQDPILTFQMGQLYASGLGGVKKADVKKVEEYCSRILYLFSIMCQVAA